MIPEWLGQISQRPNIVTIAVLGGVLATVGSDAVARRFRLDPRCVRWLLRCGHAAMWTSVALFIVAGFLPAR